MNNNQSLESRESRESREACICTDPLSDRGCPWAGTGEGGHSGSNLNHRPTVIVSKAKTLLLSHTDCAEPYGVETKLGYIWAESKTALNVRYRSVYGSDLVFNGSRLVIKAEIVKMETEKRLQKRVLSVRA